MIDYIVIAVVLLIVGCAIAYIVKEKKRGVVCVGCPNAGMCSRNGNCSSHKNGNSCSCQSQGE